MDKKQDIESVADPENGERGGRTKLAKLTNNAVTRGKNFTLHVRDAQEALSWHLGLSVQLY